MHAFHFGSSRQRLFGVYHPAAGRVRSRGVVICQPFGHEYIRAHRALRNLAARLSDAGLHVLRFDYFGCGDSAGAGEEGSLAQWRHDVGIAIDELKDMAGIRRVSVVGVRLGAALAALASSSRTDTGLLVLWDPVVRGAAYVEELQRLQAEWLETRPRARTAQGLVGTEGELIGFPLTAALHEEFKALDLLAVAKWPAKQVVTVSTQDADGRELAEHLSRLGVANRTESSRQDCKWRAPEAVHLQLLANEAVQTVAALFEKEDAA